MGDKTFNEKLSTVMEKLAFAQFDGKNTFSNYKYASAASIIRKFNAALVEEGLHLSVQAQLLHFSEYDKVGGKAGSAAVQVSIQVNDGLGGIAIGQGIGQGSDKGDKSVMKANTAAYKYAIAHMFAMSWGAEDPEEGEGGYEEPSKKPKTRRKKAAPDTKEANEEAVAVDLQEVAMCKTLADLDAIKPRISAVPRTDPQRAALVAKFKERRDAILAEGSE